MSTVDKEAPQIAPQESIEAPQVDRLLMPKEALRELAEIEKLYRENIEKAIR